MSDDNKQGAAEPSPASAGSVEPVAWEVFLPGVGTYDIHSFQWEAEAIVEALRTQGTIAEIVPLYRQPVTTLKVRYVEGKRIAPLPYPIDDDDES